MISTSTRRAIFVAITLAVTLLGVTIWATMLRPNFTETNVVSGLSSPTAMAFSPDGRLFVAEQGGSLRVVEDGVLLPTPFLTVPVSSLGERGLLGIAFDPDFETATNKYLYVYYTATSPAIHNRVSRFTANGNVAVPGSEVAILELNNLSSATNHNGGAMHFGPDGKLYIAVGDNANGAHSQSFSNLLGKMLRINKDGSIPGDNPFLSQTAGVNRAIWAIGLRNPFTFAFDTATGTMFINDVGQNTWEEVNVGQAGANYGWPATEGPTSDSSYTSPFYAYQHASGDVRGCAITGGTFYSGAPAQFPNEYLQTYFFADYCSGWINQLDESGAIVTPTFATGVASAPVDLKIGPDGALYYLSRGSGGVVQRIAHTGPQAPSIATHPQNQTVSVGQTAIFSVAASGSTPLTYQWQRNGVNIGGATSATYTTPTATPSDDGALFRVVVSNSQGSVNSNAARLTVTGNLAPTPQISTPTADFRYQGGTVLNFSGSATDPEDGTLPGTALTWRIDFHHDTHTHPALPPTTGSSGSHTIPSSGETSTNVWLRVYLTATDSGGQAVTIFRDIHPRTVQLTLQSDRKQLALTLDGAAVSVGHKFLSVVGVVRTIGAPSPQVRGGVTYAFQSWSDGGAQTHNIVSPTSGTTYKAFYRKTTP
jgi:glucose/arabinose dehydrogenase